MKKLSFLKGNRLLALVLLITVIILFIVMGYLNSYIGYFGYDKDRYRRFSSTKDESIERGVFIKDLNFVIDSVGIDNIFIERAYRWGNSFKQTNLLNEEDTFKNNKPENPYQIIISFNETQGRKRIFIPQNRVFLKDSLLSDTIFIDVYIRDSFYNLDRKEVLRIW